MNIKQNSAMPEGATQNLTESASSFFNIQEWKEKLDLNPKRIIELASVFGIGFLTGVLFKRYARVFVLVLLLTVGAVYVLQNNNIMTINWVYVKELLGIAQTATFDSVMQTYLVWAKHNIVIVVTGLVGFFIGYKVG